MKKFDCLRLTLPLGLSFIALARVHAQDARGAISDCSRKAQDQGLMGDARKIFVKQCIENAAPAPSSPAQPTLKNAGRQPNQTPIMYLQGNAAMAQMIVLTGSLEYEAGSGKFAEELANLRLVKGQLDDAIEPAVKSAKGKPDLTKAIKDFYLAASAFMSAGIPTNGIEKALSARLGADLDAKDKSLDLEKKLAGIK